ncbi:MAG: S-layer homology domain-containing protein, partial [Clostridia bacterium]|nr:S-layer homology domain-containing protein [Clostridia bacterium]
MLLGMMVVGTSAAAYPDVTSAHNVEAIEVMKAAEVMIGDENGNFNPDKVVTRAEMSVIICKILYGQDLSVASFA